MYMYNICHVNNKPCSLVLHFTTYRFTSLREEINVLNVLETHYTA